MTSLASDSLLPLVVPGIVSLSGPLELISVPDALVASGAAYFVDYRASDQAIILDFRDPSVIALRLAGDCCRLSCAFLQTVSAIGPQIANRNNVAWCLVKLYYSAFYAGNALIRLLGESCSYFEARHIDRVSKLGLAQGSGVPPFQVGAGLFHCVVEGAALAATRVRAGAGGTHEHFWDVFAKFLDRTGRRILQGPLSQADSQAVCSQLDKIRNIMQRGSEFSWLSLIRNDLQYKHKYGVWFPERINKKEHNLLIKCCMSWQNDPMTIVLDAPSPKNINTFAAACSFIISLCYSLLVKIGLGSSSKNFANYGPIAFMNEFNG